MLVYHGTPMGGDRPGVTRFLSGRHALIPFPRQEDVATAADVCQSFCFDNGAFSAWKKGEPVEDWSVYYEWCDEWHRHPGFTWAIIPDVIDGSEAENDALLEEWPGHVEGVPVWHLHESWERLDRLCQWPRICLGSSGDYSSTGTPKWWQRMRQAMKAGSRSRQSTAQTWLRIVASTVDLERTQLRPVGRMLSRLLLEWSIHTARQYLTWDGLPTRIYLN